MNDTYFPGSEWLYIKIYSSAKFLDDFLVLKILPLVSILYKKIEIKKFFFVRYTDEIGTHLRLRFLVLDNNGACSIINRIHSLVAPYKKENIIYNVIIDTYERELGRYGAKNIESIETIFSANSIYLLSLLQTRPPYDILWLTGVKIGDILLSKFNYSAFEKHLFYEMQFKYFLQSFGYRKIPEVLKIRYREFKKQIETYCCNDSLTDLTNKKDFKSIFCEEQFAIDEMLRKCKSEEIFQLLGSVIHMHYNRLFRTAARKHELVIYYMLSNFYKSYAIRNKINKNES